MARVIKAGDIFEILTRKGLAYGQVTHRHKQYGELVRILPGFFREPLETFESLVGEPELFKTFIPLGAAAHRNIFRIVGNTGVPEFAQQFPIFRDGVADKTTKKVGDNWWLWDGEKEWWVGALTDEQRKFPIRGIWNDTLLIERIENGWNYVGNDF